MAVCNRPPAASPPSSHSTHAAPHTVRDPPTAPPYRHCTDGPIQQDQVRPVQALLRGPHDRRKAQAHPRRVELDRLPRPGHRLLRRGDHACAAQPHTERQHKTRVMQGRRPWDEGRRMRRDARARQQPSPLRSMEEAKRHAHAAHSERARTFLPVQVWHKMQKRKCRKCR